MVSNKRFRCKWCNGTGFVSSGARCLSCNGTGWYENPASANTAVVGAVVSGLLSIGLLLIGRAVHGWSYVLYGLSLSCLGMAMVCLAIRLRGSEEKGWNWLMLIGTLLVGLGILSIPAKAIWGF